MTIETIVRRLKDCRHVVVFSGAGTSAESGIPTSGMPLQAFGKILTLLDWQLLKRSGPIPAWCGDGTSGGG
jgi:NAD-dependent SIR2 family protein deacetylase